jgi:glutaredoxin
MKYILFVKEECPFCVKALELLQSKGLNYKIVLFEPTQEEALREVKTAYEWDTVPMIFYRNGNLIKFIGGYTELAAELENE